MKKFLLLTASCLLIATAMQIDARKMAAPQTKAPTSWHPHHRMTQAEKVEHAEKAVSENKAILAALGQTKLATSNPAAYQRVVKALSRSESRLSNLESGKRAAYKPGRREAFEKRAHEAKHKAKHRAHEAKHKTTHRGAAHHAAVAKGKSAKTHKTAAKKPSLMERMFGTSKES